MMGEICKANCQAILHGRIMETGTRETNPCSI